MLDLLECGTAKGGDVLSSINTLKKSENSKPSGNLKTVTLFGDSFTFYQKNSDQNDAVTAASCWSFILSDLSSVVSIDAYSGVGGNNSSQMLARLQTDVLDFNSDFVFAQVGVNDFYGFNFTAQQVFDNVTNMINQIVDNGQYVIWLNCPPQNVARSGFSSVKSAESAKYNSMLEDWSKDKGMVTIVDVYSDMVNTRDNVNGAAKSDLISTDNIHLSVAGALQYSESFNRDAGFLFRGNKNKSLSSPLDLNLVNGSFSGVGGSLGSNSSGVVPDGWILSAQPGNSVAGSVDESGFTVECVSSGAAQNYFRMQSSNLSGSFSGGEMVNLEMSIDVDSDVSVNEIRAYAYSAAGAQFSTGDWGRVINGYTETTVKSKSINIKINPYTVESSLDDFRVYVDVRLTGNGNTSVKFKTARLSII